MTEPLHPVQLNILRELLFKLTARFTDLNVVGLTSDHFNFHIKRLVEIGYVEKVEAGYGLTKTGKEFSNRMDTVTATIEKQAKLSVKPICVKVENGVTHYLAQQRLKQPYFGMWGFPGGKLQWGETIYQGVARELLEETGLTGKFIFKGVQHKLDVTKENGELLEDKFFYVFKVESCTGDFQKEIEGHKNQWLTKEEMLSLDIFTGVTELIEVIEKSGLQFIVHEYLYDKSKY